MSRYERAYGTDWADLDEEAAINRAYALGVAASIGEYHPEELDAIRDEVGTTYQQSVVDLAFEEGKTDGQEIDADGSDADRAVWAELVEDETVSVDADEGSAGGPDGLPEVIDQMEVLDRHDIDSTDLVDLPDFLERD